MYTFFLSQLDSLGIVPKTRAYSTASEDPGGQEGGSTLSIQNPLHVLNCPFVVALAAGWGGDLMEGSGKGGMCDHTLILGFSPALSVVQ